MRTLRSLLAVLSMAAALGAQTRIWVVDAANGPGTDFTSLAAAVQTVAPGDRLVVRPGAYQGFALSKPLSIVGGPGVYLTPGGATYTGLAVSGIPAGAGLLVRGVAVVNAIPLGSAVTVSNCPGTVLLEDFTYTGPEPIPIGGAADMRLTNCTIGGIRFVDSTASVDRCIVRGTVGQRAAVVAERSTVVLSRCDLAGADEFFSLPPGPAIMAVSGTLIVTGDGSGRIAAGAGTAPVSAISGAGSLLLDPHAPLLPSGSAPPVGPGVLVTPGSIPSLRTDGGEVGGTAQVELFAVSGRSFVLVVGLPARPVPLPVLSGSLWLHAALVAAVGSIPPAGRATFAVPLPDDSRLFGLAFTWQAAAGDAATGFTLSNPGTYVHGF